MSDGAPRLRVTDLGLSYEPGHPVFEGIGFDVEPHELMAVVGESGCGKTSLLRVISGLQRASHGRVALDGEAVRGPQPRIALVFQHYADTLLPWKNVRDNVAFGLRPQRGRDAEHRARAQDLLEEMGLGASATRYPWELSGGMQQRVALARALARRPSVLLLDEPFSAIDERRRDALQELLLRIHGEHPCSIVMVSHNLENVLELTRRVLVLSGRPSRGRELSGDVTRERLREALGAPLGER